MESLIMKINLSTIFIISAGILSLIGAYLASVESSKDKNEIIALTKENSELSKESLNQITGGNSWGYLVSGLHSTKGVLNQTFTFSINLIGNIPLYDLTIDIYEIESFNKPTTNAYFKKQKIFSKKIGTLVKSFSTEGLGDITLPDKKRVDYLIKLKARNGDIIQHWIFIKKNDKYWAVATKVYRYKPNNNGEFIREDLLEEIDADFPNKNIEWIISP